MPNKELNLGRLELYAYKMKWASENQSVGEFVTLYARSNYVLIPCKHTNGIEMGWNWYSTAGVLSILIGNDMIR